jgi:hypothetical protein
MPAYSFLDVSGTFTGPTGSIELGSGSANSEEGIVVYDRGQKHHDCRR